MESPREALALARRAAIPPLPDQVPPSSSVEIILRATRPAPADRFGTAEEMEMALAISWCGPARPRRRDRVAGEPALGADEAAAIDRPEVDLNAEDLDPTEAEPEHDEVSGLLEPGDAPDLNLIQNAAETFHSEFLTRVLREELLAVAGGRRPSRGCCSSCRAACSALADAAWVSG